MKQLKCEMCGGTDLIKQDGVFVCQSCGVKYSVEEAKRMMVEIEGTVEVKGTVKVDSSDGLNNLYQLARRAKESENNDNAAKYYDLILIKDPTSWEANFFSVYFKSMGCKIGEIPTAATAVNNCIFSTYSLIKENVSDTEERKKAITEVCDKSKQISKMMFDAANNWMQGIDQTVKMNFAGQFLSATLAAAGIEKTICDKLCIVFKDDHEIMSSIAVQLLKDRIAAGVATDAQSEVDYVAVIKKYDPSYVPPQNQTVADITKNLNAQTQSSGGCYVATCVYGSYDCPQVWTLRRYRDNTLASTWYGRAFIRTYYAISPTIVKWFGNTQWFKTLWKNKLDKMVFNLRSNGVEDTPYQDKDWR